MKELENRYRIARWISRKLTGVSTWEEEQELEDWRAASEKNAYEYEEICRRLQVDLCKDDRLDMTSEWRLFQKKLPRKRDWFVGWKYAVAASVVIGVLAGMIWHSLPEKQEAAPELTLARGYKAVLILSDGNRVQLGDSLQMTIAETRGTKIRAEGRQIRYDTEVESSNMPVEWNTIEVPRGAEYELILEDGTKVWLNSESRLTYPVRFAGNRREVKMSGEICFDVARNEQLPFIVRTGLVAVEVLGTLFNVEAYPEEHRTVTTLVEGKIEVAAGGSKRILKPDQQAVVREDGQVVVKEVYAEDYISWTNGNFHFTETSLEEILTRLARWYNIEFFFAVPSLKEAHFTLDIQRYDHISAILAKIEKTGRVKFNINGKTIVVCE